MAVFLALSGCDGGDMEPPVETGAGRAFAQVDAQRMAGAREEGAQWFTTGRGFYEQRYSPLTQVNEETVGRLGFAWDYHTGTARGLEATPVVVDGVLYTSGNFGRVYALDARTGEELWTYNPQVPGSAARKACCDAVNRGVAVWQGKVYVGTLDGRLVALDAADGRVLWEVDTIIARSRDYTSTGAPRVAGEVVVIGNAGAEFGVRGYISAYHVESGELQWRFFTVPGSPDRPYEHPELEMAAKTWDPNSRWEAGGGGTVWDAMAYDPELDLLYVGTGNASPYPAWIRSPEGGDNLFLASILAIRPDAGRLVWHYQTTPRGSWDYTATQHIILATLEIDGEPRRVLMQAPKNGFFYVLDRATGELLSAEPFVKVNWASHVDPETGRPVPLPAAYYEHEPKMVFPWNGGGHNWQPMVWHPGTGLVYIPAIDVGLTFKAVEHYDFEPHVLNDGLDYSAAKASPLQSALIAWDPLVRRPAWRVEYEYLYNGGLLATAGNLVVQGTVDGLLTAYAADTGERLLALETGTSIMAAPATYAIDGTQYIVVMAGYGGALVGHYPQGSAARRYGNAGRIIAFKLDGGPVPIPPEVDWDANIPALPAHPDTSAVVLERGERLFGDHCARCHQLADEPGGYPNLLRMAPGTHAIFDEIVLGGVLGPRGMASFDDVLDEDDTRAIHDFLIVTAYELRERKGPRVGSDDEDLP